MASIQKRPDGKWRARYRDETGKEHSKHFARKLDAQRWLNEVTASVLTGTWVDPRMGAMTLERFFADWSERQIWERNTRRAMNLAVKSCTFNDVEFSRLRRSHAETWVKTMQTAGLAPLTINARVVAVRTALRAAVRDRVLAGDPTEGVPLPRKRRAEHAMTIPTPEQVHNLYEAAEPFFRPFIGLCAFAGLRPGEANGTQLADIKFLRRTLEIRRQVQREAGHEIEIRAPKYGSERDVFMPDRLAELLSRHVDEIGVYGDAGWLFMGRDGGPARPRAIANQWDKTRAAAGVRVRAHDLRHFYASGLIAAGCDVVTVQRALGHNSPSVTLNTYSHLWPTAEDKTRDAAADLMGQVFESMTLTRSSEAGPSTTAF